MANYLNENNQVAFSRGNKGFFAMVKWGSMDRYLQTGELLETYWSYYFVSRLALYDTKKA